MADLQTNRRVNPPLYIPQGRPPTRTRHPNRPDWLDAIKRPLRVVAPQARDIEDFMKSWRFDDSEVLRILLVTDLTKLSLVHPLLILPGGEEEGMIGDFCPVRYWREKGGAVITVPACAVRMERTPLGVVFPHFPIETNLCAETLLALATQRHLDSLNRAP